MSLLKGKVAIVTGAAVGIGREIAITLGREGASVVVNYAHSRADAETTAEQVKAAGGEFLLAQADVSKDTEVRAMVAKVVERFGRIDVLVNNAGITAFVPFSDLDGLTDDIWDRLYGVNVKGTFFCCRAVAEPMRRAGGGRIINIASVSGIRPQGSSIAYCASKAAVIHASECLAKALAPEIAVNVVAPGFIDDTRWNVGRPNIEAMREGVIQQTPMKRLGHATDIAETVRFLATTASYMSGAVITVDGGRVLA